MKTSSTPGNLDGLPPECAQHPSFGEAFLFCLKLGFISFRGLTGQIAIMHTELVEKANGSAKRASSTRSTTAYFSQLATYVGWLLHKTWVVLLRELFSSSPRSLEYPDLGVLNYGRSLIGCCYKLSNLVYLVTKASVSTLILVGSQ
jgi:hypothetical protein